MPAESPHTLPYEPNSEAQPMPAYVRVVIRTAALAILLPAVYFGLIILGKVYASTRFPGVSAGMTRAQVDRHLWGFASAPSAYNTMGPTDSAVAYDFLGFGKTTEIKVIYDANGVVVWAIPSFDN